MQNLIFRLLCCLAVNAFIELFQVCCWLPPFLVCHDFHVDIDLMSSPITLAVLHDLQNNTIPFDLEYYFIYFFLDKIMT